MIGPLVLAFILGMFTGAFLGILIIGLARAAHQADEEMSQ